MGIAELHDRSQKLRAEVKAWEKSFVSIHGHKPAHADLKEAGEIAQKSKEYYKLRERLSGPDINEGTSPPFKKRRISKADQQVYQAPPQTHPSTIDPYDSPRAVTTPRAIRTVIGPTPQRNGTVLGLFDLLSPPSTHSASGASPLRVVGQGLKSTPSRSRSYKTNEASTGEITFVTPQKKTLSNSKSVPFLTPPRRPRVVAPQSQPKDQPARALSDDSETPAFLRRGSQRFSYTPIVAAETTENCDDAIEWSPIAVRLPPRRPLGRSLSALVQGLRRMEEDALDEDLEILHDLEATAGSTSTKARSTVKHAQPEVEMPLGADGTNHEDESGGMEKPGRSGKAWKKKGQKRTTRKATMRPAEGKWKPEPAWALTAEIGSDQEEISTLGDTTTDILEATATAENLDDDSSPAEAVAMPEETTPTPEQVKNDMEAKLAEWKTKKAAAEAAPKVRVKRKCKATAHANFRTLNIKNKQSKAKGGGRFSKRR